MIKVAVLVFDWDWKPLGHVIFEKNSEDFPQNVLDWDQFNRDAAKTITKVEDIHCATCLITGDEPLEITQDIIDELKSIHAAKTVNFTETWDFGNARATSIRLPE